MKTSPIGLFDSGVGGTTVWQEVTKVLPYESTIYIADTLHLPYGGRSKEEIIFLCKKNTAWLISKGCKLIIVSCNTATTSAIKYLRTHYDIPFIGVEPAVKPASIQTKTNVVGVLATKGTLTSDLFAKTSKTNASHIRLITQNGDGLVELIETGKTSSKKMRDLLTHYLTPMLEQNIDCLVLGCTHYPIIKPIIKQLLPPHIIIVDSGRAIAKRTKEVLKKKGWLQSSTHKPFYQFYTTLDSKILVNMVKGTNRDLSFSKLSI